MKAQLDYGVKAALEREEEKEKRRKEQHQNKPPKPLVASIDELEKRQKTKHLPKIDLYPLQNEDEKYANEELKPEINWNDENTVKNSKHLFEMLNQERKDCTPSALLSMGAGTGKTSSAVRTIGETQLRLGKKIPFIVISKPRIIDGRGWQKTIKQWNVDNPDNQIQPVLIDTVDKFANKLTDARVVKQIVKELDIKNSIIICDEVHLYKTPTSKRSKKLHKLSFIKKLGLSATLITNDAVFDIGSYLILANFYNSKNDFMNRTKLKPFISRWGNAVYKKDGSIDKEKWPQYYNVMNQYSSILYQPDTSRIDKMMPDINQTIVQLPYNEELQSDMKSLGIALKNHVFENHNDYYMEFVRRLHHDKQRLNKLIEIITQDNVKQPLIFYQNVMVKGFIEDALKEAGYTDWQEISGQSKSFGDFDHSNLNPVLAQYTSAAEGIELKNSNTTVFYQNQRRADILTQVKGRNRRLGMKGVINHYHILADDVNDQYIYDIAQQRKNVEEDVMKDAILANLKQRG